MLLPALPQDTLSDSEKPLLVMLGTGTPNPDPNRSGPASAVLYRGVSYLIDCGPGVVRRCTLAASTKNLPALQAKNLRTVFITHLHSDHTLGYPDLILTPWVVGRTVPLEAYGPNGLAKMTRSLLAAYREDIELRIHGLEEEKPEGAEVHVHEVKAGVVFKNADVTVTAFVVKHGSWKAAFGYRFDVGGKVIVFSGDTRPCEGLLQAARGADILVHEAYEESELTPEPRPGGNEWPAYMRSFHTSAKELGRIAADCRPKLLVINHVVRKKDSDEQLIAEVREGGYTGAVVVAKDMDVFGDELPHGGDE
jgi:ribonuclease BN (tRNA processing enzyme)